MIQQSGLRTQEIEANADYLLQFGAAKRPTECASRGICSTKHPSPSTMTGCCCGVYSRMIHVVTKDARWLGCSSWSLYGGSQPKSTDSCSLSTKRLADCVSYTKHRGCIRNPTHRSLLRTRNTSYCRRVYQAGSAQVVFDLIKDRCNFSIGESDGPSRDLGPKSDGLGNRIPKIICSSAHPVLQYRLA